MQELRDRQVWLVHELMYQIKVREVMTKEVICFPSTATFREIQLCMKARRFSGTPIVDGGELVGMVSIEDIISAFDKGRIDQPVAPHMTRNVVTIPQNYSVIGASNIFDEYGFGRLPVVSEPNSRRIVGIVTVGDILRHLLLEVNSIAERFEEKQARLATGAEKVYLHEEGVSLRDLVEDLEKLIMGFKSGKRLGLMIRNESANKVYTTPFMAALFEEEGGDLFDVRTAILGHLQQGGDPSPFDRIQATRLAGRCIEFLAEQVGGTPPSSAFIGLSEGKLQFQSMEDFTRMADETFGRPKKQWWLELRPIARLLAQPGPAQPGPSQDGKS